MVFFVLLLLVAIAPNYWASVLVAADKGAAATTVIYANCRQDPANGLNQARDAIRALQPLNASVEVQVIGQCWTSDATQPLLTLFSNDSIVDSAVSVTWKPFQGRQGGKHGVLSGGVELNPLKAIPSQKIMGAFDIDLGPMADNSLGSYSSSGLGGCSVNISELIIDGVLMNRAREPNAPVGASPWLDWLGVNIVDTEGGFTTVAANRTAETLLSLAAQWDSFGSNGGVWAHGYWSFDWADSYVQVTNITTTEDSSTSRSRHVIGADSTAVPKEATTTTTFQISVNPGTPPVYGFASMARFYLVNHIALLDAPGEYVITTTAAASGHAILTFIPPYPLTANTSLVLTRNGSPLIVQVDVDRVLSGHQFHQLVMTAGRGGAVRFPNAARITFSQLRVSGFGQYALSVAGWDIVIRGCYIASTGCHAIDLGGGDPLTLVSARNIVVNSTIRDFGRFIRSYNPAVQFSGVGLNISGNFVGQGPHAGLLGSGNNHWVSHNVFEDLCYGSRDAGAFYMGRSWTQRGTVLSTNVFRRVAIVEPTFLGSDLVTCIYWDDQLSGNRAEGNRFHDSQCGVLLGGGRDNVILGNTCRNTSTECVLFDNRGMNWEASFCTPPDGLLVQQLLEVKYLEAPYATEYPSITATLSNQPCVPVGNVISGNRCEEGCGLNGFSSTTAAQAAQWGSNMTHNTGGGR